MKWHAPVDPECPEVANFNHNLYSDPMSELCGCLDEIQESWEARHAKECERCREYGCANIEVVD